MIFFATLPALRVAYPGCLSSRHIWSVPSSPPPPSRQSATVSLRHASRPIASAARRFPSAVPPILSPGWTIGRLPCRYSRNGEISIFRFPPCLPLRQIAPSPRPPAASRLPPRPPCRGAGRRPFPSVCGDNVDCPIYIYNLSAVCYSIGVEREQKERTPK